MTLKPEHIVEALNKKTFDEIDPDEGSETLRLQAGRSSLQRRRDRCMAQGRNAFQKLGDIGAFMRFVDHKAKPGSSSTTTRTFQRRCLLHTPPQRRKISFPEACICILEENKEKIQSPLAMSSKPLRIQGRMFQPFQRLPMRTVPFSYKLLYVQIWVVREDRQSSIS